MRTRSLLLFLTGFMLLTIITFADGYEYDNFVINLYQGWDTLDEGRLVFGDSLYDHHDVYDFIRAQYEQFLNARKNSCTVDELRELFEEDYTPILFTIYAKTMTKTGSIYIEHLYTENYALKPSLLRVWEYQYRELPKVYGPSSSIRISLPEKHLYKCVFLIPNEMALETVTITIEDAYYFRQYVSSK